MSDEAWGEDWSKAIAVRFGGSPLDEVDPATGERLVDDDLLLLLNASEESVPFTLPAADGENPWLVVVDTASSEVGADEPRSATGSYELPSRSLVLLACSPARAEE